MKKEIKPKKEKVVKEKSDLFDIVKCIFSKRIDINKYSNYTLERNFFMLNRFMSIAFPMQANALQHISINNSEVIKFWKKFCSEKYATTPPWIFIKGGKRSKEDKEKGKLLTSTEIQTYALLNKLDSKQIKDALYFFPDQMTLEIKEFLKNI